MTIKINTWIETWKQDFKDGYVKVRPFDYQGNLISGIEVKGRKKKEQLEKFTTYFNNTFTNESDWESVEIKVEENGVEVKKPATGYGNINRLILEDSAIKSIEGWTLPTEFRFELTRLNDSRDGKLRMDIKEKGLVENSFTPQVKSIEMPVPKNLVGAYDEWFSLNKNSDLKISKIKWHTLINSQAAVVLKDGKLDLGFRRDQAIAPGIGPKLTAVNPSQECVHPDERHSNSVAESRQRVSAAITRAREAKDRLFKFGYINDNKQDFQEAVSAINDLIKIAKDGNKAEKEEYKEYMPWQGNGEFFKGLKDCINFTSVNNGQGWKYDLETGEVNFGSTNQPVKNDNQGQDQGTENKGSNDDENDRKRKNDGNDDNSREPKRAKIEDEIKQDLANQDKAVTDKLTNDLAGLASQSDQEKEQRLANIERIKNKGGVYEQQKEQVKEKKDELAKSDPQGYGKMIAKIIQQKIEEFKLEIDKLGNEIKEKIKKLQGGEITSDEQVREIEEEVSEKVSEEVANVETNDLLTQAQQLLSKQAGNLKSQLEKIKKDLYSLKLSTNPFQQKAYELKKTEFDQTLRDVERHLNQNQTVKPNPTPWGVIIPASLAAVVLAGIVGAVIARRKNRARVK